VTHFAVFGCKCILGVEFFEDFGPCKSDSVRDFELPSLIFDFLFIHNLKYRRVDFKNRFTFDFTGLERECIDLLLVTFEFTVFDNKVTDVLAVELGINL